MAAVSVSRVTKVRRSLTGSEWRRLSGFYSFVALLHVVGWGVLILLIVPSHFKALGIGAGLTAYGFGLRHAFDADHISAIDNTTRKLLADGKKPLGVGFFFSLGHSTIVFGLSVALVFAAKAVSGQFSDGSATLTVGGYVGTAVSAFFLYVIAAINLVILVGIIRIFRELRQGKYNEVTLEDKLNQRGLMNRVLGPLARKINSSWQMYPVGVLFGLGFDTATEVAFLALAAGVSAVGGIPWYGTLCLPVLFAAGMCLMDTTDGAFMNVAYGWAFSKPIRKVFYNLTITGLSVAVALLVGTVEILSIVITYFKLSGGVWDFLSGINLNVIGFIIVGTFVVTWLGALAIWRFGRIEQRWALAPTTAEGPAELRANAVARERLESQTEGQW